MLRSRAEARPADSIGNFRRQLRVLQRTGPAVAALADGARLPGVRRAAPPMPGVVPFGAPLSPQAARRARTLRRRRDVLGVLLVGMTGTLLVGGVFSSLRVLLWLHAALDLVFVGYIAMLVRARNESAEREMKLRFLPAAQPDNVILFRRSAN